MSFKAIFTGQTLLNRKLDTITGLGVRILVFYVFSFKSFNASSWDVQYYLHAH